MISYYLSFVDDLLIARFRAEGGDGSIGDGELTIHDGGLAGLSSETLRGAAPCIVDVGDDGVGIIRPEEDDPNEVED